MTKKGTHNETQEQIFKRNKRNDPRRAKENPPMPQRGGIHCIKKSGAQGKANKQSQEGTPRNFFEKSDCIFILLHAFYVFMVQALELVKAGSKGAGTAEAAKRSGRPKGRHPDPLLTDLKKRAGRKRRQGGQPKETRKK